MATLYFLHAAGAVSFAAVVPLLPIAPLVNAAALIGQEQAVLRSLLDRGAFRMDRRSTARLALTVVACGVPLSILASVAVSSAFPVSTWSAFGSAIGGVFLALTQACFLSQVRALRSGSGYALTYAAYGSIAFLSRALALEAGWSSPAAWAVGDALAGIGALGVAALVAGRLPGPQLEYSVREGLRYGTPLLPHSLAQNVLSNADRWIFAGRVAPAQLAAYVASYQVANIVNIALAEVNRSRQHQYVGLSAADAHRIERRERGLLLWIVFGLTAPVVGVSVVAVTGDPQMVGLIAAGICLSFASVAFYLPLANLIGLTVGKTGVLARASITGAVINVALNIVLVHPLGVWAGMIANLLGFFAMYFVLTRFTPDR